MENSSQTQHCRSKTNRKEEQKTKENEAQQIFVTTCEIAPARPIHPTTVHISALFTCISSFCCFCCNFFVSSHFVLVIAFSFSFFLVISYTLSTYIRLSLYKLWINHFGNTESGRQVPRCFLFLPFFFPFLSITRLPNTPLRMTTQMMVG